MSARRTLALILLCATLLSAAIVTIRFAKSDWDPSAFVRAGNKYGDPVKTPKNLTVVDGIGYDGQFYYRLALDPFSGARTKFGITLDRPGRRQERILYPLLAWIVSGGGKPGAVPWALILINAIGLVLVAWVGTALARAIGRSPWWGLAFACVPGLIVALTHDTGDIVAALLAMCFLWLWRVERYPLATLALTAAAFARETTLVFALGLLVAAFVTRRREYLIGGLIPLGAFAVWQIFLGVRWGTPPVLSAGGHDIGAPLYGLILAATRWVHRGARVVTWNVIFSVAALAFLVWCARALRRSTAPIHERAALVLTLILVPLFRSDVWFNFTSYLRAMTEAMVLGLVIGLSAGTSQR